LCINKSPCTDYRERSKLHGNLR